MTCSGPNNNKYIKIINEKIWYYDMVIIIGMSRSDFFFILSICRYRVLIWYLSLTNIFLDNTAALRKKYLHPSCFLISFFILLKQSIYFDMARSYSACYYNIDLYLPFVSRWVCDAALWQQTSEYSQLKCVRRCSRFVPPYHRCFLHILYVVT